MSTTKKERDEWLQSDLVAGTKEDFWIRRLIEDAASLIPAKLAHREASELAANWMQEAQEQEARADDAEWMLNEVIKILIAGANEGREITANNIRDVRIYVLANLNNRGLPMEYFLKEIIKDYGEDS